MYIEQAYKLQNEWWRYLITFFIVLTAQVIGSLPLTLVIILKNLSSGEALDYKASLNPEIIGISQNMGLILLMLPMVLTFFALLLAMRYIHGQSLREIFTSATRIRWKNFFFALFAWGAMLVVAEIITYGFTPEKYSFNYNASEFFVLLLIAVIMVPMQAGAEELYFRGNLFQGIGILSRSKIVSLLVTSLAFGLLHFSNPEVKQFGLLPSMTYYVGFGLFMGILVLLDGGLEMPIAIHAVNNFFGATLVGYSGSVLQTPSLIKVNHYNANAMLIFFLVFALLYILISKRVFKWKNIGLAFKMPKQASDY